jgi:polyhydroxybutyrate depolymerase
MQSKKKTKTIRKAFAVIILSIIGLILLATLIVVVLFSQLDKTNGRIISSGQVRKFLLHLPPNYDQLKPLPLVISIHGFAEWPAHQMQISGWNDLADEYGFIVVYPSGTGFPRRWRASGQAGDSSAPMLDVIFISDLIDELEHRYNIDPNRIYANGLSNGGGMSYLLGCKLSAKIAAIGSVAGAYVFPISDCKPSRPVPMIAFHGTSDPIVPYQGGPSRDFNLPFPAIPEWMAARAELNGCAMISSEMPKAGEVRGILYSHCTQGAEVVFYSIQGGGHSWPGGEPLPEWIVGQTSQDINATRTMWEFFRQFSLAN